MSDLFEKVHGESAVRWFASYFVNNIVSPITSHFPEWALPKEIKEIQRGIDHVNTVFGAGPANLTFGELLQRLQPENAPLFKRMVLLYRRHRAMETERLVEKTFHLEITDTLEAERKALDAITNSDAFLQIDNLRLPSLGDFLPVQLVESAALNQVPLAARQFDEKFHILQAPGLFLQDLAYFRAKCEDRDTPLGIGFVDIDGFKALNTTHGHSKVDRNVLPRFMQAMEAHLYQHGYAYRQGGEEYLLLLPNLSKNLAIRFLDELRSKLAQLTYPEIVEKTTVSIGLCIATPECPLTDRELRERANRAEQFAKDQGKDRIATFAGMRLADDELMVASP